MIRILRRASTLFSTAVRATAGATMPDLDDPAWERRELFTGVELLEGNFKELFGVPQIIKILRVKLDEPTVRVGFAASRPDSLRTAPVPAFAASFGAIAAINGGYTGGGEGGQSSTNAGIFKIDGEVHPFEPGETGEFYFVGEAALGIDAAGEWHFRNRPGDRWPADWPEMAHALAGAHRLIEEGRIHPSITRNATVIETRHAARRHPRTAIGLLPNRTALLMTVDGRYPEKAEGMTLEELATWMKAFGCIEALNLDGGGSTTMWLRDRGVINHPTDNNLFDHDGARRVFSAVVILADEEAGARENGPKADV